MLDSVVRVAEIFAYFGGPAALLYVGRKVGQLYRLSNAEPTLTEIAAQFKNNGGHSLKDTVDRIEQLAKSASETAAKAVRMTEGQNQVLQQQNRVLDQIKAAVEKP